MKNFKKGLYLFLLGIGVLVGLMASNALEEGNTKAAQQIIMTWVGLIWCWYLFYRWFFIFFETEITECQRENTE